MGTGSLGRVLCNFVDLYGFRQKVIEHGGGNWGN